MILSQPCHNHLLKESTYCGQAFAAAHPERNIVKKWLEAKVKEVAQHEGGAWRIRPELLQAHPSLPGPPLHQICTL